MSSLVASMNTNIVVSKPYDGEKEKVKEIRDRLIESTRDNASECIKAHQQSLEYAKRKSLK